MILEKGAQPIEGLAMQRLYKHIKKVKNMPDHKLPNNLRNIGCKVQKLIREKSSHLARCLALGNGLRDGGKRSVGALKRCYEVCDHWQ